MDDRTASRLRIRWAAIGAAVAVTLGAGTIATVDAVQDTGARLTFTAVEPCRLIDTRSDPKLNVGPRNTPLGAEDTFTIAARGTQGDCTPADLPADAAALSLNITPVNATTRSFLTIWPDGTRPNASSLNPAPGEPPNPNAVTTDLSPSGSFNVFNRAGSVDVVIDVVGHYRDHHHDDRYFRKTELYTQAEVDQLLAPLAPPKITTFETTLGLGTNQATAGNFVQLARLALVNKERADTTLRAVFQTNISGESNTQCRYQLRLDGRHAGGGTDVSAAARTATYVRHSAAADELDQVTFDVLFEGVDAGSKWLEVWAYQASDPGACRMNTGGFLSGGYVEEFVSR